MVPITIIHGASMARVDIKLTGLEKLLSQTRSVGNQKVEIGILDGATYPNGTPVSKVACYLEYGWTQNVTSRQRGWFAAQGIHLRPDTVLHSPARPFFEATFNANRTKWIKLGQSALKGLTSSENALNKITKALQLLGMTAQQDLQDAVIDGGVGGNSFAARSPLTALLYGNLMHAGGHKTDGTPNQTTTGKPLYKTGILESSIAFNIVKE